MRTLRRLWEDDRGAVLITEYLLLVGVVLLGAGAGAAAIRNRIAAGVEEVGQSLTEQIRGPRPAPVPVTAVRLSEGGRYSFTPENAPAP